MTHPVRIRRTRATRALVVILAIGAALASHLVPSSSSTALPGNSPGLGAAWPEQGQAAVEIGRSRIHAGPNQHAAPIASLAKVMTAYLILRDHPLGAGEGGPAITLTDADVLDTDRRRRQQESIVPIVAGEQLTERQALQALLLPSANNIAVVLARWDSGSVARFVAKMNASARSFGMTRTRYTDPSGYDDATVSTATDQLRLVGRAMRLAVFAHMVATPTATLPVAGTVHNTNMLLGRAGFVGVKTGSDTAAGGCFAFRAIRVVHGRRTTITGVVLGQSGHNLIEAGLAAAAELVDRIAGPEEPAPTPRLRRSSVFQRVNSAARVSRFRCSASGRGGRTSESRASKGCG